MLFRSANGSAKQKMAEFVEAQGGDASYVWDTELFPKASREIEVPALQEGYVNQIQAESVGAACMMLGGGRETKDSDIDLSVGIYLNKKVGSYVKKGEPIAMVYANDSQKGEDAAAQIQSAYGISAEKPAPSKMIKAVIQAF